MHMQNVISGTVTGALTFAGGFIAKAGEGTLGDHSPVTIGLAVAAGGLVFFVTREFTQLRDAVEQTKSEVKDLKRRLEAVKNENTQHHKEQREK
jgi:hypothetical protein